MFHYRVVSNSDGVLTIREVYFNDQGIVSAYSANPQFPLGESLLELTESLSMFTSALHLPVVSEERLNQAIRSKEVFYEFGTSRIITRVYLD